MRLLAPTSKMTNKLVPFLFLMFAAFSMKRKRAERNSPTREPSAKRICAYSTPLLGKETWSTAHSFLLPQNENKFNKMHKSFTQFFTKYEDISDKIRKGDFGAVCKNCLFFKHFKTDKIFAENVNEKYNFGMTALHIAANFNELEIAEAVIEARVNLNAKDIFGMTALHWAAIRNDLKIGRVLIEAGADLKINNGYGKTALEVAVQENHVTFVDMIQKNLK